MNNKVSEEIREYIQQLMTYRDYVVKQVEQDKLSTSFEFNLNLLTFIGNTIVFFEKIFLDETKLVLVLCEDTTLRNAFLTWLNNQGEQDFYDAAQDFHPALDYDGHVVTLGYAS